MNKPATVTRESEPSILTKLHPTSPALALIGRETSGYALHVKAGTVFRSRTFNDDTLVVMPDEMLLPGADYGVLVGKTTTSFVQLNSADIPDDMLGGFHFAPGGNATARSGGNSDPAINPWSLWDLNLRPACPDPRGMARIARAINPFWADIYLLGVNHLKDGTSKCGVMIADGDDPPQNPAGGRFKRFDYAAAVACYEHHGKRLLSVTDGFDAYVGGTEKTALGRNPNTTGLDAPRTSRWGLMQPFGAMWQWCHDGDPDNPRASIAGGSWLNVVYAGSRYAIVDLWPGSSDDDLGARGRGDHLQLV